ncbi:hypothetical protein [Halorientalis sp.]|uniref:hypothetical protein n=1 Tax=Halorientalis sp. TaxID=1931229 RepID=UPI0026312A8B|nr:hypothetical protein [Halorientalis sp.]
MAAADAVSIDEATGRLTIESMEIDDGDLVDFLRDHDPDERAEVVSEALTIGMKTMQLMNTSQDVEYVERRLSELEAELADRVDTFREELDEKVGDDGTLQEALDEYVGENGTLEERIEAAFDDDGPFVERLDKELGEDGERIQAALSDEDGPLHTVEQRLKDEIESVRDKLVEQETEEAVRSRTYLKGGDFEDSVEQILNDIVRQTPNNVEFTGNTTGKIGRDVGDFVATIAETNQRLVIEAKTESYSTQSIKDEVQEAMQNRDAAYGLFVTDSLENLPRTKTGWFHEFPDQNTVVVALSETNEDDIESGYLRIAFHWARMRAIQAYAEVDSGFDPETLQVELNEIEEDIGRFQQIRGECKEIQKSQDRIRGTLSEIQESITSRLATIEAELMKADAE